MDTETVTTRADTGKKLLSQYQKRIVGLNLLNTLLNEGDEERQAIILDHLGTIKTREGKPFFPTD